MPRPIKSLCQEPNCVGVSKCSACQRLKKRISRALKSPNATASFEDFTRSTLGIRDNQSYTPVPETPPIRDKDVPDTVPVSTVPDTPLHLRPLIRGRCRFAPHCPSIRVRILSDGLPCCDECAARSGLR